MFLASANARASKLKDIFELNVKSLGISTSHLKVIDGHLRLSAWTGLKKPEHFSLDTILLNLV